MKMKKTASLYFSVALLSVLAALLLSGVMSAVGYLL